MTSNATRQTENLSQGCDYSFNATFDSDDEMSAERFDNAMAALTFAATAITIALGFMLNL